MGQCGCGDSNADRAFKQRGSVLAVRVYRGCEDCHEGIGIDLWWFTAKSMFLDGVPVEPAPKADEYGGNGGTGVAIPLFEVRDLRAAAKELLRESGDVNPTSDGYGTLDAWLADYGLRMIQGALVSARERMEESV